MKNTVLNVEQKYKMKKLFLFLFLGILLTGFVYAESCQVVWPQFGVVSCQVFYGSSTQLDIKSPLCSNNICTTSFSCAGKSECVIKSNEISLSCSGIPCLEYSIYKDGQMLGQPFSWGTCPGKQNPGELSSFNELSISATCTTLGIRNNIDSTSTITMEYKNKYLYDTTPDYPSHKVDASTGCVPNGIMYKRGYTSQLPSNMIDSSGNSAPNQKPSNLIDPLPTNMNVGDTYSYLYKWVPVSGINVVNGKSGNSAGYCGGSLGNRKLLSYSQVSGSDGCYIIPTSVQKDVECCYNDDCKWKDTNGKYVCDPTTFTCSINRPCNSDYECQVIGEETCQDSIQTSWKCDLSSPWQPYKGTCKQSTTNVACCSDNDCPSDSYCDKSLGCKPKYVLTDCPYGKCCNGGNYKPASCSGSLQCCTNGGNVGDCKQSCNVDVSSTSEDIGQSSLQGSLNSSLSTQLGNNRMIIIVIGLIIIAGALGVWFYLKNKDNAIRDKKDDSNLENKCSHCGHGNKDGAKFCMSCGEKLIHHKDSLKCKKCGNTLKAGSLFCANCGQKVKK